MTTDIDFANIERIYPSENDIAFTPYNGVNGTEVNWGKNIHNRFPKNCVLAELSGASIPLPTAGFITSIGAGLSVNITRGRAYIQGRYIELISTVPTYNVAGLPATQDHYIYLTLNISGVVQAVPPARFTTVSVALNATHTRPDNAVLIAYCTTNATVVTQVTDKRCSQFHQPIYLPMRETKKYFVNVPDFGFNTVLGGTCMLWKTSATASLSTVTLTVQGPNGTITKVVTNVANGTTAPLADLLNISIVITPDIGRYAGGRVQVFLTQNLAEVDIATDNQAVPINGFATINETAGTWWFKEWDAIA